MNEKDLERACMEALRHALPHCVLYKPHDRVTGGQPDLEVAWDGHTTKIEFKLLHKGENIHDKWEDERQLITCVRYEQQTSRCWVVAFQAPWKSSKDPALTRPIAGTIIYRPTKLLHGLVPAALDWRTTARLSQMLWERGAIRYPGYSYGAIAELIRQTHV